jgi:hypothetical protein
MTQQLPPLCFCLERVLYCEHGNQFDPANTIKDYKDPLDTPLGDHIVTDLIRQIVPEGRVTRSFDLRDVNKVYALATIPEWVVGRFFYDLLGRVVAYLLLPLIIGYATYWVVEYLLTLAREGSAPFSFWESYRTFPGLQVLFAEIVTDASLLVIAFGLFFLAIRGTAARAVSSLSLGSPGHRQGILSPRSVLWPGRAGGWSRGFPDYFYSSWRAQSLQSPNSHQHDWYRPRSRHRIQQNLHKIRRPRARPTTGDTGTLRVEPLGSAAVRLDRRIAILGGAVSGWRVGRRSD